jgi:uncharacterized protein (TIGR00251 family)
MSSVAAPLLRPFVRAIQGGIELEVWVTPRASRPALGPLHGERLRVAVSAPPVDGAANDAVRALIADALGVARGEVTVVRGTSGRNKTLRIVGEPAALLARLRAQGIDILIGEGPGSDSDSPAAAAAKPSPQTPSKSHRRSRKS